MPVSLFPDPFPACKMCPVGAGFKPAPTAGKDALKGRERANAHMTQRKTASERKTATERKTASEKK